MAYHAFYEQMKDRYYQRGYWSNQTIFDVWQQSAQRFADKPCVLDDKGGTFTYRECNDAANRLARELTSCGVIPGDVVTIQLMPCALFAPIMLAVLKIGAVLHPVARNLNERDLHGIMAKVNTKAFICPDHYHGVNHELIASHLAEDFATLNRERIFLVTHVEDDDPLAPSLRYLSPSAQRTRADSETAAAIPPAHQPSADDLACILSTSGTSGAPKHVMLSHNNILFSEKSYAASLGITSNDVILTPSPLNHATGLFHGLIMPLMVGATAVIQHCFEADQALELIHAYGVTASFGATPFIYDILCALDKQSAHLTDKTQVAPSFSLFVSGGAPLPRDLIARARCFGITLCECYGSTESCPHLWVPPQHCHEWDGRYAGVAPEGIEVKIVDRNRQLVAYGEIGEEASRGPHIFMGYFGDPDKTNRALDAEGWFYSGDLCRMDKHGRVTVTGRIKDLIIRGGENISSVEVDKAVCGWPPILDHASVGIYDERLGERICLAVVVNPRKASACTKKNLLSYLKKRGISKRLWPERIVCVPAIPRTESGKVRRFILKQQIANLNRSNLSTGCK